MLEPSCLEGFFSVMGYELLRVYDGKNGDWRKAMRCLWVGMLVLGIVAGCGLREQAQEDLPVCEVEGLITAERLQSGKTSFAHCLFETLYMDQVNLSGYDLRNMVINGSVMTQTNFSEADLNGAQIVNSVLDGSLFIDATLTGANFSFSSLIDADLSGSDLRGVNLNEANLTRATLTGVVTDDTTTCPDGSQGPCEF